MGAIKVFLKEVVLPIALAFCLASFLKPIYMPDGVCDYFLMWICVGLPFGIRRMCLWLVPSGYGISGSVGIFALNLIIGGLIGGLAFFIGLLLGIIHNRYIFYVPASHSVASPSHSAWWCRFSDALRAAGLALWAFLCLWQ